MSEPKVVVLKTGAAVVAGTHYYPREMVATALGKPVAELAKAGLATVSDYEGVRLALGPAAAMKVASYRSPKSHK